MDCLGLESQLGEEIVFFSKTVPTISGANPASYSGVPSLLVAGRPECEADHSPPSSDEVKDEWSCTSAPPVCLMDNLTCFDNVDHMGCTVTIGSSNKVELRYNIIEGTE